LYIHINPTIVSIITVHQLSGPWAEVVTCGFAVVLEICIVFCRCRLLTLYFTLVGLVFFYIFVCLVFRYLMIVAVFKWTVCTVILICSLWDHKLGEVTESESIDSPLQPHYIWH